MDTQLHALLAEIDRMKAELDKLRHLDNYKITEALDLEYIYESNRIEGNSLTLLETDFILHKGGVIDGKSLKEHLEAINHRDALNQTRLFAKRKKPLKERAILQTHELIMRAIDVKYASKYRQEAVTITGSKHIPPQHFLVPKQMRELIEWFDYEKDELHPVILAAELHERIATIHPFTDGNGRTARLMMNLILLQHGYAIANIKGDHDTRQDYYNALERAQTTGHKNEFIHFIAEMERDALERYLNVLG